MCAGVGYVILEAENEGEGEDSRLLNLYPTEHHQCQRSIERRTG